MPLIRSPTSHSIRFRVQPAELSGCCSLRGDFIVPAFAANPGLAAKVKKNIAVGDQALEFKIKDAAGWVIDFTELTKYGPVLVRLS